MRLSRGGYLIREGFRSIKTHSFMSFASVTIIMACLIIMGSVFLLSMNIDRLIGDLEDQNEVVALVDESYSSEQAQALQSTVASIPNVSDAAFVDRAVAMDTFMNNFDSDFRDGIDETVFRHRFVIHLNDISLMSQTEAELENVEGIVKVKAHLEYANAFITIRNIVSVVSLVLTVILVFVSMFIMSNTIKLATFGRREEIAIMKMVGATNSFIRLPFIIEGLVLGVLGGGLAFLAEWGLYSLLASRLMGTLVGSFISVIPFTEVAIPMLIAYLGMSVFVGVFGGVNAIRNYLKV
ncbi:MAG: permease-like cell division protein FtsX [Oscillospiraceae bacterium]|jgi:Cell division protein|nr:permease-like cell division protein FtsX [Oscillospiraceae bacterium]